MHVDRQITSVGNILVKGWVETLIDGVQSTFGCITMLSFSESLELSAAALTISVCSAVSMRKFSGINDSVSALGVMTRMLVAKRNMLCVCVTSSREALSLRRGGDKKSRALKEEEVSE